MAINNIFDIIIIGAGISGISAANYLSKHKLSVKLIDKGKSPGGRLASKRIKYLNEKVTFDYGCKFLSAKSFEFGSEILNLFENKTISKWNFVNHDLAARHDIKSMKIIGKESIRSIALEMAKDLDILTGKKIVRISRKNNIWELLSDQGEIFHALEMIISIPAPQIIELFDNSNICFPKEIFNDLKNVKYMRNMVAMFICDGPGKVPLSGGIQFQSGDISFITDNNLKGVNQNRNAFTIEMSDNFSRKYWNYKDEKILSEITQISKEWIGSKILYSQIHRWKFSQPLKIYPKRFEFIDKPGSIYLVGDAFLGKSAESGYLSGLNAAKSITSKLERKNDLVNV